MHAADVKVRVMSFNEAKRYEEKLNEAHIETHFEEASSIE
jgi:hypothetical protein